LATTHHRNEPIKAQERPSLGIEEREDKQALATPPPSIQMPWTSTPCRKPQLKQRNKNINKKGNVLNALYKATLLETAPNESNDHKLTKHSVPLSTIDLPLEQKTATSIQSAASLRESRECPRKKKTSSYA